MLLILNLVTSCKKDTMRNGEIYLKLNLSKTEYASLNQLNGILYIEEILIARVGEATYAAVAQYCDSNDCVTEYSADKNTFSCPCTGTNFDMQGVSIDKSIQIKGYNTLLEGNILHVFE